MLDYEGSAYCLFGLASIALAQGRHQVAARLVGAADHARRVVGAGVWPGMQSATEALVESVTAALGQILLAEISAQGSGMRVQDALDYELSASAADADDDPFPACREAHRQLITLGRSARRTGSGTVQASDTMQASGTMRAMGHLAMRAGGKLSLARPARWRVAAVVALAAAIAGCGAFKSASPLTAPQLTAMTTYYEAHNGRADYRAPFACAVVPLGDRRTAPSRLNAYTNVICVSCPPNEGLDDGAAGEYPAVFLLHGERVISVAEADAPGDPMYFDEVKRLFPHALWKAAGGAVPDHYLALATNRADCSRRDHEANVGG